METAAKNGALERRLPELEARGRPLSRGLRNQLEPRFARDLSGVRIHDDASGAEVAEQAGARAFTYGRHVVFGRGQFQPHSAKGQRLLAHELTHAAQQGAAPPRGQNASVAGPQLNRQADPALTEAHKLQKTQLHKDLQRRVLAKLDAIIKAAQQHDRRIRTAAAAKGAKGMVLFPSRIGGPGRLPRRQRLDKVIKSIAKSHNLVAGAQKSPCRVAVQEGIKAVRKPTGYGKADWDRWAGWQTGQWLGGGKPLVIRDIWKKAVRRRHGGKDILFQDVTWFLKNLKSKKLRLEKVGFNMSVKMGKRDLVLGFDPKSDEAKKKMKLDPAAVTLGAHVGYPFQSAKGKCRCLLWFSGRDAFAECLSPQGLKTSGGQQGRGYWNVVPILLPTFIYFNFEVHKQIRVISRSALSRTAQFLKANPQQTVELVGHADAVGTREFNERLGRRRAEEVKRRLLQLGVDPNQIRKVSSRGRLDAKAKSAATRWKDRRVEIRP